MLVAAKCSVNLFMVNGWVARNNLPGLAASGNSGDAGAGKSRTTGLFGSWEGEAGRRQKVRGRGGRAARQGPSR